MNFLSIVDFWWNQLFEHCLFHLQSINQTLARRSKSKKLAQLYRDFTFLINDLEELEKNGENLSVLSFDASKAMQEYKRLQSSMPQILTLDPAMSQHMIEEQDYIQYLLKRKNNFKITIHELRFMTQEVKEHLKALVDKTVENRYTQSIQDMQFRFREFEKFLQPIKKAETPLKEVLARYITQAGKVEALLLNLVKQNPQMSELTVPMIEHEGREEKFFLGRLKNDISRSTLY